MKGMKRAEADGFRSAAKMKWRVSSNCMGAINLHSKPEKLASNNWMFGDLAQCKGIYTHQIQSVF
jgi:hypothetical protein